MSNELLADIDNMSNDKLMAMIGQDIDTGGSSLSRLSINWLLSWHTLLYMPAPFFDSRHT